MSLCGSFWCLKDNYFERNRHPLDSSGEIPADRATAGGHDQPFDEFDENGDKCLKCLKVPRGLERRGTIIGYNFWNTDDTSDEDYTV